MSLHWHQHHSRLHTFGSGHAAVFLLWENRSTIWLFDITSQIHNSISFSLDWTDFRFQSTSRRNSEKITWILRLILTNVESTCSRFCELMREDYTSAEAFCKLCIRFLFAMDFRLAIKTVWTALLVNEQREATYFKDPIHDLFSRQHTISVSHMKVVENDEGKIHHCKYTFLSLNK